MIDWTQPKLAEQATLGLSTVVDFERERRTVSGDAIASIKKALEAAGVEFTNGGKPGVRLQEFEVGSCVHNGEPGVYLRLGAGAARRSFSYKEAQKEALRFQRMGNKEVALALKLNAPVASATSLPEDADRKSPIKIGDFVKLRENRPAGPPGYSGIIGRVVDPGTTPPDPTKVYVRYKDGDEFWIDRGALLVVPAPG